MLPLTLGSVRLDQRFAIDPCSPSLLHLAMRRVTSLEPRTPHQPGKLGTCQRTSMFLLLPFIQSIKNTKLYLLCLQSSAAAPQAPDQIWCSRRVAGPLQLAPSATFRGFSLSDPDCGYKSRRVASCGKCGGIGVGRGFTPDLGSAGNKPVVHTNEPRFQSMAGQRLPRLTSAGDRAASRPVT
jgi:hypothetical protein